MRNAIESVKHPMYPADIMGDGEDQHTVWVPNICIGTTWDE